MSADATETRKSIFKHRRLYTLSFIHCENETEKSGATYDFGSKSFTDIFYLILYTSLYFLFIYWKLTSNITQYAAKYNSDQSAYGQKIFIYTKS